MRVSFAPELRSRPLGRSSRLLLALILATVTVVALTPAPAPAHTGYKTCRSGVLGPGGASTSTLAGQVIHVSVKNGHWTGLQVTIRARPNASWWQSRQIWLGPYGSGSVHFSFFSNDPIFWRVSFSTPASVAQAAWKVQSYRCG